MRTVEYITGMRSLDDLKLFFISLGLIGSLGVLGYLLFPVVKKVMVFIYLIG